MLTIPLLQGCEQKPDSRRFQIISAVYETTGVFANGSSATVENHTVFKIDTQTGQTWLLTSGVVQNTNGVPVQITIWSEVK